ncbi:MAG: TIGR03790 family protein [Pirellulales bacterium]
MFSSPLQAAFEYSLIRWVPAGFMVLVLNLAIPLLEVAKAGGGAENIFLLVNSESKDSLTVANHYIGLRKIPAQNVHYVKWQYPDRYQVHGATFLRLILLPALKEIQCRGLGSQIDYLVYSCDFPTQLNFQKDFPGEKFPPQLRPQASLTGATYLSQFVVTKRKEMFNLNTNFYAARPVAGVTVSRGFRSNYYWGPRGKRVSAKEQGISYLLSAMLGVTFGRGNQVEEVLHYLKRARDADGTHPEGTVYFMKNGTNPRSTARHGNFSGAAVELRLLGVKAQILDGKFPQKKKDIIGVTTGTANFNFGASGCRLLPGALGDNLTSYGGQFFHRKPKPQLPGKSKKKLRPPQTPLTEFLRYGAAGASGTVVEPYAIQAKFPLPSVHVHYARGCSLAEAFYQSVTGPFQLLVIGDPLCRPWANIPRVAVEGIDDGQIIRGKVRVTPTATLAEQKKVKRFELFVDGLRTQLCKPGAAFQLDTTAMADGYHEVRVIAIEDTPIETQGRWVGWVNVKNGKNALQMTLSPASRILADGELKISITSTTSAAVAITHNGRELGLIKKGQGNIRVQASKLGKGPVTIQAKTKPAPGQTNAGLTSRPVSIEVY